MSQVRRLRTLARSVREVTPGLELPYLALEHVESHIGQFVPGFEPKVRRIELEVLFQPGDVLFGKLRPYLAKVLAPGFRGAASGEFLVLRASTDLLPRFLFYLCLSRPLLDWAEASSVGTKMPRTGWERLSEFRFQVPSVDQQRRLANFLDRETTRIDALIEAKRRLIDLVSLRRQAVVSNAVLGRLDARELVRTGDASIPELPSGWRAVRLRHAVREITVGVVVTPAAFYADEGLPFIRGFNVSPGRISRTDLAWISPEASALHPKSVLRSGDVLVVRTGQAGAAAVVPEWAVGGNCVDTLVVRCNGSLSPQYLESFLNSYTARRQIETLSVGAIQGHLNVGALQELVVPLPPRGEQDRLVRELQVDDAKLEALTEALAAQVGLLVERRQSLITSKVSPN